MATAALSTNRYRVGDVVTLGRPCMGNPAGARALVVELYGRNEAHDETGITLLFENGQHDGFSASDRLAFHVTPADHLAQYASYEFVSALWLHRDWQHGAFAATWKGGAQ